MEMPRYIAPLRNNPGWPNHPLSDAVNTGTINITPRIAAMADSTEKMVPRMLRKMAILVISLCQRPFAVFRPGCIQQDARPFVAIVHLYSLTGEPKRFPHQRLGRSDNIQVCRLENLFVSKL